jgi:hypothetical protein
MKLGILEFRDNDFIHSVLECLRGVPAEFVRVGHISHPSPSPFRVVVDRVSFCDPFLREVLRYWSIGGAYVLNDPFFSLVFDKLSELPFYDALGIRHARSALLPRFNRTEDMREMVAEPDWQEIEERIGFPCILKPVDGFAWQDVFRVEDPATLRGLYESLRDSRTLMVQELVRYAAYYRAYCVDRRDVFIVGWKPLPFDRGIYSLPENGALHPVGDLIIEQTIALNAALGLDFNAVEWCVTEEGVPFVIDSYNDVPDVRREKLPAECYDWVVDRFSACVRSKLVSEDRNGLAPKLPVRPGAGPGSDPGPAPRG